MNDKQNQMPEAVRTKIDALYSEHAVSDKIKGIIETLLGLTHIEGAICFQVYSTIAEQVFGITATAVAVGGGAASEAAAKPEKTSFKVKIVNVDSIEKLPAARTLQTELGVGLKEASDLLKVGTILNKEMPAAGADDLVAKLAASKVIAEKV
jgi:large subunit ribosomal protein L7/L12